MSYQIPLFDLHMDAAEEEAVLDTLRSKWLSMGSRTAAFEEAFAAHLDIPCVVALSSCTAALHLALRALDIGEGDDVLVPSLTFVATVNAVRYVGANPVFVDVVGPHDLTMDPSDLERKISKSAKAVMVMHYAGFPAAMDRIMELAVKHGLKVVEDAAHAPASDFGGRALGTIGHIGCFSFFSNKNITCAEGGALATSDDTLAGKVKLLRSHGMTTLSYERAKGHATRYDVVDLGYNYRLDDMRASMLLAQMKKLKQDTEKRRDLWKQYCRELAPVEELIVPFADCPHPSSCHIMPVLVKHGGEETRDRLREFLASRGIQTSVHYPAVHRFSIYRRQRTDLPRTDFASDSEVTLPLYYSLSDCQVTTVTNAVKDFFSNHD